MKIKLWASFFLMVSVTSVSANSLPDVIESVKKSVVAVGTYMPKRSPKGLFLGTGFAIADGSLIVTNAHVVLAKTMDDKGFEKLAVFSRQNDKVKKFDVKVVAIDKVHDIALLKLIADTLPALKVGLNKVREGDAIAFTGYPIGMVLGLYSVTHRGIVSAFSPVVIPMIKSRHLSAKLLKRLRDPYYVYQLDATAYPGNSGSPVYKAETGEVIAILNKVFIKESKETVLSNPSGISYAIPVRFLNDLLRKYHVN